jgi:hypothetical protein
LEKRAASIHFPHQTAPQNFHSANMTTAPKV